MKAEMTAEAIEARRAYQREYRRKNRERINSQKKNWCAKNKERIRQHNRDYWQRVADRGIIPRASYAELGISDKRLDELWGIIGSGQYDALVVSAARKAGRDISEYILMSVRRGMSYDALKIRWELKDIEPMPYSRTSFYAKRRLFFYYLDCELRGCNDTELKNVKEG